MNDEFQRGWVQKSGPHSLLYVFQVHAALNVFLAGVSVIVSATT